MSYRDLLASLRGSETGGGVSWDSIKDLPPWLRDQFVANYSGDSGEITGYLTPGGAVVDEQGRQVALVNPDGSLADSSNIAWNQGAQGNVRDDPNFGLVTDMSNVNQSPYEQSSGRLRGQAAALFAAIAGGGMADAMGLFGNAAGTAGAATGTVAPGMEGLAAGGAGAGITPASYAGLGGAFDTAAGLGAVAPGMEGLAEGGAGAGLTPEAYSGLGGAFDAAAGSSPFTLQNGLRVLNGIRGLLGGGQGSRGGSPLMGGVGSPQPSVMSGFRRENLDKALATANHGLLPQDPMEKVKQAMMARQQPEKNPWDYQA